MCTYTCSQSYDNQYYDDMMSCLLVDYECLSLPPPDEYNDATCRDPSSSALTIDDDTMTGDWYVLQGYNPTYDCWDCAKQTFDTIGDEVDYAAFFNMLAANGTEMWVSSAYTGTKSSENTVYLATTDFGMPDEQTWYPMYRSENTLVTYYCGSVMSWHFEGLLVMSKTTSLDEADQANVLQVITDLGFTEDELCTTKPETCASAPFTFIQ